MVLFIAHFTTPLQGFYWSYAFWFAWEIKDGIAPWYDDPRYVGCNIICKELWLSNKFSFQDAFIWDLLGASFGMVVATVVATFF